MKWSKKGLAARCVVGGVETVDDFSLTKGKNDRHATTLESSS